MPDYEPEVSCEHPDLYVELPRKVLFLTFGILMQIPFDKRGAHWEYVIGKIKQRLNETR